MIARDKALHLAAGAAIAACGALVTPALGYALCAAAAYGKELRDRRGHGECDGWDCAATLLGGICVAAIVAIPDASGFSS